VQFEGDWFTPVNGVREVRLRGAYTDYAHLTGDVREGFDVLAFIPRNVLFAGTEVKLDFNLLEALGGVFGIDAQMDCVQARFTSGVNRNVPGIPPIRW